MPLSRNDLVTMFPDLQRYWGFPATSRFGMVRGRPIAAASPPSSSLRASFEVMPAPLAAFSPLAITKSTALVAKAGQPAQQRVAPWLAEHVADEEDVHARRPE